MGKKFLVVAVSLLALVGFAQHRSKHQCFVNVYDWYGMLPKEILDQFEAETGIHVRYDMFDNNEVLEAKLLASNSGYDVVFPSASPYAARQIHAGVYQPLNKSKIPNAKDIKPLLLKELRKVDPDLKYVLPHAWGTTGIIYDKDKLHKLVPAEALKSYRIIFDPTITEKIAPYGISLLEEPVDVFPLMLRYLGKNPDSIDRKDLDFARVQLMKVRPHIKRFSSSRMINDLIMGEVCVAQIWSAEAYRTIEDAKEVGRNLAYIISNEGTSLWIDAVAIPVGAPNVESAHKFIDFLLRPDINAKLTNMTAQPFSSQKGEKLVRPELRNDSGLYPSEKLMKKLTLDKPQNGMEALQFDRDRTRVWAKIRQNKGEK